MTATSTTTKPMTVAVLGAGKVAQAVTSLLLRAGAQVQLWARDSDKAKGLSKHMAALGPVRVCGSVAEACGDADVIAFAVPAPAMASVARAVGAVARGDQIVLHVARGVEPGFVLGHQIVRRETCIKKIGVLGGPLYLDDAHAGRPLVAVLGARFDEVQRAVQRLTQGTPVRLHPTSDVVGVEVAGAISNVAQLAAGLAHGVGLGETDQGILLTRGLLEATRIGVALGAQAATFTGLAGVGDMIPRPVTSTKKHRALGERVAAGERVESELSALEGPLTAREAVLLGQRAGLELPLCRAVDDVLQGKQPALSALEAVLRLDLDLSPTARAAS
jgi:glycerol-3-phosphate dehydrogenase (NAD(P)+)